MATLRKTGNAARRPPTKKVSPKAQAVARQKAKRAVSPVKKVPAARRPRTPRFEPQKTVVQPITISFTGDIADARGFVPEPERVRSRTSSDMLDSALNSIANMNGDLADVLANVAQDKYLRDGVNEAMDRWQDFGDPARALLAGAYLDPSARRAINADLDDMFSPSMVFDERTDEVVIGSGIHAAIYCAVRARMGAPKPLVVEARPTIGGAFALSTAGVFYLNSRNRPGDLSIPGEDGALNVVPGALIQPSDLGGEEFQSNAALAWVVRMTLAMNANVITNTRVTDIRENNAGVVMTTADGTAILAKRVIVATGIGLPKNSTGVNSDRIIPFDKFMQMLGRPFPLRGMKRVAVIGGGDGARTAVEALTGQGPTAMTTASVDWPKEIDWYGAPWFTCQDVASLARIRYKRMAALLPDPNRPDRPYRVQARPRAEAISAGFNMVYVNQKPYDYLIDCTGYVRNLLLPDLFGLNQLAVTNEIRVGRKLSSRVFVIGPASDLEVADAEVATLRNIEENRTSLFRYAPRTAALAASL